MIRKKILSFLESSIFLKDELKLEIKDIIDDLTIEEQKRIYKLLLKENEKIWKLIWDNIKTKEDVINFQAKILKAKKNMYEKQEKIDSKNVTENILDNL